MRIEELIAKARIRSLKGHVGVCPAVAVPCDCGMPDVVPITLALEYAVMALRAQIEYHTFEGHGRCPDLLRALGALDLITKTMAGEKGTANEAART